MPTDKIELLAPAGNRERLDFALRYGADAVYCGGKQLSLRSYADNFSIEELHNAVTFAHSMGKRVYVAVNAFLRDRDLPTLPAYLRELEQAGTDAVIATDPAVIISLREHAPGMELHISTQANTLNSAAAKFYQTLGAKRIILARELTLDEIKGIRDATPETLELEAFVHGAMCISYSGRCLLSNLITGRDGNRGECAQPCRWSYEIRETGKDGAFLPIEQDEHGTYLLNSNDLMLIEHLDRLIDAGVTSFKIEGRMKTAFYVASVVNAYRMALDALSAGKPFDPALLGELEKLRHRPYTTGFLFGDPTECRTGDQYLQTHDFVAVVLSYNPSTEVALVEQRNRFFAGELLEVLSPNSLNGRVRVLSMTDEDGIEQTSAPHPKQKLLLSVDGPLSPYDILRKPIG